MPMGCYEDQSKNLCQAPGKVWPGEVFFSCCLPPSRQKACLEGQAESPPWCLLRKVTHLLRYPTTGIHCSDEDVNKMGIPVSPLGGERLAASSYLLSP